MTDVAQQGQEPLYCPMCNARTPQPVLSPLVMSYVPGSNADGTKPLFRFECGLCFYSETRETMPGQRIIDKRSS